MTSRGVGGGHPAASEGISVGPPRSGCGVSAYKCFCMPKLRSRRDAQALFPRFPIAKYLSSACRRSGRHCCGIRRRLVVICSALPVGRTAGCSSFRTRRSLPGRVAARGPEPHWSVPTPTFDSPPAVFPFAGHRRFASAWAWPDRYRAAGAWFDVQDVERCPSGSAPRRLGP